MAERGVGGGNLNGGSSRCRTDGRFRVAGTRASTETFGEWMAPGNKAGHADAIAALKPIAHEASRDSGNGYAMEPPVYVPVAISNFRV